MNDDGRLKDLIQKYVDGTASETEVAQLSSLVAGDPEAARSFARATRINHFLYQHFGEEVALRADPMPASKSTVSSLRNRKPNRPRAKPVSSAVWIGLSVAAAACLLLVLWPRNIPPRPLAVVQSVDGPVSLQRGQEISTAKIGTELHAHDVLVSTDVASATIVFTDKSRVDLKQSFSIAVSTHSAAPASRILDLKKGAMTASITRQVAGAAFAIKTPHARVTVVGTQFTVAVEEKSTRVDVEEGTVDFSPAENTAHTIRVKSRQFAIATPGVAPVATSLDIQPAGPVLHVAASAPPGGNGSAQKPFHEIQRAIDAAEPGMSVLVHNGVYRESLKTVRDGTPEKRIVIRAENSRQATVTHANGVLRVAHAWISVEGFVFDGAFGLSDVVMVATTANHLLLRNVEVSNSSMDGVDLHSPQQVTIEDCSIHHALAAQKDIYAHGIVTYAVTDLTIRNTEIFYCSGNGISLIPLNASEPKCWDNVIVDGCKIWSGPLPEDRNGHKAGVHTGQTGILATRNLTAPEGRLSIRRSEVYGWQDSTQEICTAVKAREKIRLELAANKFHDNEVAIWTADYTLSGRSAAITITVANCIFYNNVTAIRCDQNMDALLLWNNTFGLHNREALQIVAQKKGDYRNNLFIGATVPAMAADKSNLRIEANAVENAAVHTYRLIPTSPAVNAGVPITGVATDVDGVARPAGGKFDVGAYELIDR